MEKKPKKTKKNKKNKKNKKKQAFWSVQSRLKAFFFHLNIFYDSNI